MTKMPKLINFIFLKINKFLNDINFIIEYAHNEAKFCFSSLTNILCTKQFKEKN